MRQKPRYTNDLRRVPNVLIPFWSAGFQPASWNRGASSRGNRPTGKGITSKRLDHPG